MKKTLIAVTIATSLMMNLKAQSLIDFGTSGLTIIPEQTTASVSQTSNSLSYTATVSPGSNIFTGFVNVDWTAFSLTNAILNLSLSTVPSGNDPNIQIDLFDSESNIASGSVTVSSTGTNQNIPISFNTGLNFPIVGMTVTLNNNAFPTSAGLTYNSLSPVPEPSTYALMALGGLVLFFMVRRRKVQA